MKKADRKTEEIIKISAVGPVRFTFAQKNGSMDGRIKKAKLLI